MSNQPERADVADSTALHLQAERMTGAFQPPRSLSSRLCGAEFWESRDILRHAADVFFSTEGADDQAGVVTCVLIRAEKTDGCF